MLKKIKLIQGIGNYTKTTAGGVDFGDVTVIYAENRNGKSTLCDVIHSLSEDDPNLIMNRKSIPSDPTKPPKVEFMFDTSSGNVTSKFENGQWQVKTPDCSKLYVFDHSFIHRNVITGQKQERTNSENMTGFILGESSAALYKALAEKNKNLREERLSLSSIEGQFTQHGVTDVSSYANSPLPVDTKDQLELHVAECEKSKHQILTTIGNIDKIKNRNVLSAVGTQVHFDQVCDSINAVLASSLQNVHQDSLVALQSHMSHHVNDAVLFKGWASQGIAQIKDDCPFCGQALDKGAQGLITAYQQAFNVEFDKFNNQIRTDLNNLRQPFIIPNTRENLFQQHQANKQIFELYVEPQITSNQALATLNISLDQKYEIILSSFESVIENSKQATEFWSPRLEQKFATPYEPAELIGFDALNEAALIYNQAIYEYWLIAEQANVIFNTYKASLNELQLREQLNEVTQQQNQAGQTHERFIANYIS